MPIENVNGAANISGFNEQPNQEQPDQHTQDEEFILEYLKQVRNLSDTQALAVLSAMINADVDIGEFMSDLRSNNATAVATIDNFII